MDVTKAAAWLLGFASLISAGCCCNQPGGWGGSTFGAPGMAASPPAYPAPVYGAAPAGAPPVAATPMVPPTTATIPATTATIPASTTTLR